jgi:hypothetical protein
MKRIIGLVLLACAGCSQGQPCPDVNNTQTAVAEIPGVMEMQMTAPR